MRFLIFILFLQVNVLFSQVPDSIRASFILSKIQNSPLYTPKDSIKNWYQEAAFSFALSKHWKSASSTLRKGSEFLLKNNEVKEAKSWLKQAEAWEAEFHATKNLEWANVMEYGALLNQRNKDEKTAFALWKDCLEIRKKQLLISDPLLYKTYFSLAVCAEKNGEWETARECVLTCQALNNKKDEKIKFSLKSAEISMNLMDYRQALYAYLPLLKSHQDSLTYALFIAECYIELRFADSASVWLELWHKNTRLNYENTDCKGYILHARKSILEKNTRTALNWIREARSKVDTSNKISADLDVIEGEVWEELSLLDNAEKCYLSAYQWQIDHGYNEFSRAFYAWKLGKIYVRKRLYDKALTFLLAAESPFFETLGKNSIPLHELYLQIAELLHIKNNYQEALSYTDAILKSQNFDPFFNEIKNKARILENDIYLKLYSQVQDINLVKISIQKYLKVLDELVQNTHVDLNYFRSLVEKTIALELEMFVRTMDSTWLFQAWNLTDQNRIIQCKISQNINNLINTNKNIESNWLIEQQQITYTNLWKRALSGKLSIWEQKRLHSKLDSLQEHLMVVFKHDSLILCDWTCKPWQVNSEKYVISYFIGQENHYAFCSNTKNISFKIIGNQQNRDERVNNFRKSILFRDFPLFVPLSYRLYEELLMPLIQSDVKNIKKLVICPDSYLFYLPFEALSTQQVSPETPYHNIPYLINKTEISYSIKYPDTKSSNITQNIILFQPSIADSLRKRANKEGFTIVQPDLSQEADTISKDGSSKWLKPGTHIQLNQIQNNNFVQWNVPFFIKEDSLEKSAIFFSNGMFHLSQLKDFKAAGLSFSGIEWGLSYQNKGIAMLFLIENFKNKCQYANIPLWKMDSSVKLRLYLYRYIKFQNPSTALKSAKLSVIKDKNSVPFDWAGLQFYEMP